MIITRSEFESACDCVDGVSGTVTVKRCTEDNAARHFPHDNYLAYLEWVDNLNVCGIPESPYADLSPLNRFERNVAEVVVLLEENGTLYLEGYRTFLVDEKQILFALNRLFGMAWVFESHVAEAVKRKRQERTHGIKSIKNHPVEDGLRRKFYMKPRK